MTKWKVKGKQKLRKGPCKKKKDMRKTKKKYLEDIDLMLDIKYSEGVDVSLEKNACSIDHYQPQGMNPLRKRKESTTQFQLLTPQKLASDIETLQVKLLVYALLF